MTLPNIPSGFFERLADASPDWEVWLNEKIQVAWTNQACKKLTGYEPTELIGSNQKLFAIFSSKYSLAFEKLIKEAAQKKTTSNDLQSKIVTKNQKIIWVSISWQPIYYPDNSFAGIRLSLRDLDQRITTEEKNQLIKVELERSFTQSPIGIAEVSLAGQWLKVNKKLCQIFGLTQKELMAINFQKITHPDDLNKDLNLLKQTLAGKIDSYEMEKRYFHKDGHIIWAQLNVSLIKDENKEPLFFVSQIQDITERKTLENRYDYLFESINAGISIYRVTTKNKKLEFSFVGFNHAAEKIEKLNKKEILGKEIRTVIPAAEKIGLIAALTKAYKTGEKVFIPETKYLYIKNQISWQERLIYKLNSGEIVCIFRDITDYINNRDKLKEKINELESLNNFMVDRELKMIELKKELEKIRTKTLIKS